MQILWLVLLLAIETPAPPSIAEIGVFRPFDGTYTIVNKANGWRIFASKEGSTGCTLGPIFHDQMWVFTPQENASYAIVNSANSLRLLAQTTGDGERGFFAMSHGPVYQDQRWWLSPQSDGSYVIENVKSGRRILAKLGEQGQLWFAAVASRGPVIEEETWWIVNQEKDETARYMLELKIEKDRIEKNAEETAALRNESIQLMSRFQSALQVQGNLSDEVSTCKHANERVTAKLQEEQSTVLKMATDMEIGSREHARLQVDLFETTRTKDRLLSKVNLVGEQRYCWMIVLQMDTSRKCLIAAVTIALIAVLSSFGRQHFTLCSELKHSRKRITVLEQEFTSEFGDMVQVGDTGSDLGCDFGFRIFDAEINQEAVRLIKIQCPGVKHSDVEVELLFNGCEVVIRRQASRGVASTTWNKRFQFRPSDGLFEFREEQMQLEDGFLQLVFRTCAFHNRLVLFPRHFSLSTSDTDACWDYAADGAGDTDQVEAWWYDQDMDVSPESADVAGKIYSAVDVDTESTASTARILV
jgi:hypothetical protein